MNLWQKFKESEIFKNWFKTNQQNHNKNQESNRISFFNRMQDLGIPYHLASADNEGKVEDLSDITRNKKKSCCIIL